MNCNPLFARGFGVAAALLLTLPRAWGWAESPATAPVVVLTSPTLGLRDVDPRTSEIRIVFDRPMQQSSWSWCGGGEFYPKSAGSCRYIDDRTAVMPVRLEPQHTYTMSINCPSAQGFRSAGGVPTTPYRYYFTTGNGGEPAPSVDVRSEASWRKFRDLFRTRYSYYERTGTAWEKVLDSGRDWVLSAPRPSEWAMRVALLLEPARDPHLYFRTPDSGSIGTCSSSASLNANWDVRAQLFPEHKKWNRFVWSARRGNIGYIEISSWSSKDADMAPAREALDALWNTRALIVDVRANGGGDEPQAQRFAQHFIQKAAVYSKDRFRDPEAPGGYGRMLDRRIGPPPDGKIYPGHVFLLQGPLCMSSNESFLLMMKQSPNVRSIGETSRGSSGNPRGYDLPNGVQVVLPQWQDFLPNGTLLEGRGVAPDFEVKGDFTRDDPVLREALRLAEQAQ